MRLNLDLNHTSVFSPNSDKIASLKIGDKMIRIVVISVILSSLILEGCNGKKISPSNNKNESADRAIQNAPPRLTAVSEKEVTFSPAYSYLREDNWVVDLRGWVHQSRKSLNRYMTVLATLKNKCDGQSMDNFKSRSDVFESDDKFGEKVIIEFDSDPDRTQYLFKVI